MVSMEKIAFLLEQREQRKQANILGFDLGNVSEKTKNVLTGVKDYAKEAIPKAVRKQAKKGKAAENAYFERESEQDYGDLYRK